MRITGIAAALTASLFALPAGAQEPLVGSPAYKAYWNGINQAEGEAALDAMHQRWSDDNQRRINQNQEAVPPTGIWQGPPVADNAALAAAVNALRAEEEGRHLDGLIRAEIDRARASVGMGSKPYSR